VNSRQRSAKLPSKEQLLQSKSSVPAVIVGTEPLHMQAFDEHSKWWWWALATPDASRDGCARMGLKTALFYVKCRSDRTDVLQSAIEASLRGTWCASGHSWRLWEKYRRRRNPFPLLNTSRGPAVWSPRAQCDKQAYRLKMREVLESQGILRSSRRKWRLM